MSKPLTLEIGKNVPHEEAPAAPVPSPASQPAASPASASPAAPTAGEGQAVHGAVHSNESLAEIYEAVKRHEETLRDMVVEIRLLYHNLAEKEKQRLETRREGMTREVREGFAHMIRMLEDKIARLRGK